MATSDEYIQPATPWVAEQLATIDETGTTDSVGVQGMKVVVFTIRGKRSGKLRRVPLMRVEHEGRYAAVGSSGGASKDPVWVASLKANPQVELQDGDTRTTMRARLVSGEERAQWWQRCVAAFPPYAEYQQRTDREIPVFVCAPAETPQS